jgi:DNA-binding helix-hairpin-helix protein with protein kinase domain
LERFFIDQAEIPGVGPAKKAALRSFGIETAADVNWQSVYRVKGFGDTLTMVVVSWRQQIEKRFRFNPQTAITEADKSAVRNRVATRKLELESHLIGGLEELRRIKANSVGQTKVLGNLINNANQRLAQAIADLQVIK